MANPIEAASAREGAAVTPSDTATVLFDALYVGAAGDVTVTPLRGGNITFVDVPAGTILPIAGTKVLDSGTDADLNIVALRY